VSEFQRALVSAFEAGPAEVLDLRIDRLDGRPVSGHAEESIPACACLGTFCAEPVPACICRTEGSESIRSCLAAVAG
jgi:hypothetical protein